MKNKLLLTILTFILFISFAKAETLDKITFQWDDDISSSIYTTIKDEDSITIFSGRAIIKYQINHLKTIKKYTFKDDFYNIYELNNNYVIIDGGYLVILDKDLNVLLEEDILLTDIHYITYENNVYKLIGNTRISDDSAVLHYYEINNNFEMNHKFIATNHPVYLAGTDEENVFYFKYYYVFDHEGLIRYKFDGEFSEVEGLGDLELKPYYFPEGPSSSSEPSTVTEAEYTAIFNKYGATDPQKLAVKIIKDGENYLALYGERTFDSSVGLFLLKEKLVYYDKNLNMKWEKEVPSDGIGRQDGCNAYGLNSNIAVKDDIFLLAYNSGEEQVIELFDRNGTVKKDLTNAINDKLNLEYVPRQIYFTNDYLLMIYTAPRAECLTSNEVNEPLKPMLLANIDDLLYETTSKVLFFSLEFDVKTRVTGEGTITSNVNKASPNDIVEITVEPEEGYVLGTIKVIDAEGNIIPVEDNKFIMPASDVTIEVEFLPISVNPKTADIAIALVIVLTAIALFLMIHNYKRMKRVV